MTANVRESLFGRRLGDLLVDSGQITRQELKQALEQQSNSGSRLGQVLVEMGLLTHEDIARCLAEQLKLDFVDVRDVKVDPAVARLVHEASARRHNAVPLRLVRGELLVATLDPRNVLMLDDIRLSTGKEITPVVVTEEGLNRAFEQAYRRDVHLDDTDTDIELRATGSTDVAPPEQRVVKMVDAIVGKAVSERASDIHIEPTDEHVRVRYRIDGDLYEMMTYTLDDYASSISRIKILADMDISERRTPQDGRIQVKQNGLDIDLRISSLPTIHGEKIVIRILNKASTITELPELGLANQALESFKEALNRPYGMILVTGPTGSGKTTTLMSALYQLNSPERNIITVEDPVEYEVRGVNHVQVNPRAGLTFSSGLRSILRQDPNVIMIGEIRDKETAEIAVRSALTGHLVLSSVHANNSAGTISRLIDMGIEPVLVASSVIGSMSQRLVRIVCQRCIEEYELSADDPARYALGLQGQLTLKRGRGCHHCNYSGYHGRTGLFEFLPVSSKIREMVVNRASDDVIYRQAVADGMRPLLRDGMSKIIRGITTPSEVQKASFFEEETRMGKNQQLEVTG